MKRFLVAIVVLLFAISCPLVAFASEEKKLTNEELYACYQEVIEKTNEKYGYSFSLVGFEDMPCFWSIDEFQNIVDEYCRFKAEKSVTAIQAPAEKSNDSGNRVVTVSNAVTETHALDTVTITFYGTFDIKQNITTGRYYIDSESYTIYTRSQNGIVTYEPYGTPTVNIYDQGRTHYAVQNFRVLVYGSFDDYDSVRAGFYLSPSNGNISPLSV